MDTLGEMVPTAKVSSAMTAQSCIWEELAAPQALLLEPRWQVVGHHSHTQGICVSKMKAVVSGAHCRSGPLGRYLIIQIPKFHLRPVVCNSSAKRSSRPYLWPHGFV